jgi:hypothetical protein
MPQRLQAAALELLERVRIGLDLPSRSEVLALADRLEALGQQIATLEQKRSADAEIVAELRAEANTPAPRKPRTARRAEKKAPTTKVVAKKEKGARKKSVPKDGDKTAVKTPSSKKKKS